MYNCQAGSSYGGTAQGVMNRTFLNTKELSGIERERSGQLTVNLDTVSAGTPAFVKNKSQDISAVSNASVSRQAAHGQNGPHELDQKYTSILKMDFDGGSEQMIEEEIESNLSQSNQEGPGGQGGSSANKNVGGGASSFEQITEEHRCDSYLFSDASRLRQLAQQVRRMNNFESEDDRSDLLFSNSRVHEPHQAPDHFRDDIISETQFDDRDDIQSQSNIPEEIFSRQHTDMIENSASNPPVIKKRTLRDKDRNVQSTHDVTKSNDLQGEAT